MPTTCTNIIPQIQHSPIENSRFFINNINPIIDIATFPFFSFFSVPLISYLGFHSIITIFSSPMEIKVPTKEGGVVYVKLSSLAKSKPDFYHNMKNCFITAGMLKMFNSSSLHTLQKSMNCNVFSIRDRYY